MEPTIGIEIEKAIRFLSLHMPFANESTKKPTLFHGIRVGIYLYMNGYSQGIVIAGFLHDILEDTSVKEEELIHHFGVEVTRLVSACTKDRKIKDSDERTKELIQRCAQQGENALIVKTADILDSFSYYTKTNNINEIQYCLKNVHEIVKNKSETFKDPLFEELKTW